MPEPIHGRATVAGLAAVVCGLLVTGCHREDAELGSRETWPVNPVDAVFLWESRSGNNEITTAKKTRVCRVEARGRARYFRNGEMDPGGGHFLADNYSSEIVKTVMDAGSDFTVEAVINCSGEPGEGIIIANPTLALVQRGRRLVFTAAEPSPVSVELAGEIALGTFFHFAAMFDGENWIFRIDDELRQGELTTPAGPAVEGLQFGGGGWEGKLVGVAIHSRDLPEAEVRAHAEYWKARIASWPGVKPVTLQGRLRKFTPLPVRETPGAYREALAGYEYEVEEVVEGELDADRVLVRHWVYLDGKALQSFPREVGQSYLLELEPFAAHPQLQSAETFVGDEDFNLQLFYDVATPKP